MIWDDTAIATLKHHASAGHSATVAAAALGTTRNAILGKAFRLGVSFTDKKVWTAKRLAKLKQLAAKGMTARGIASALGVTPGSVHMAVLKYTPGLRRLRAGL